MKGLFYKNNRAVSAVARRLLGEFHDIPQGTVWNGGAAHRLLWLG